MSFVPAICSQCGAQLQIDDSKEAAICDFCGTAFISEKAIQTYNVVHNIHLNTPGNTVNIFYNPNEKSLNTDDCFSHFYNVKIKRKKRILNGCAVVFVFEVNEKKYELRNGGEISFRTNQKHLDIQVLQQASFGSDKPFCGHLTASCDGKDVDIVIDIGDGFNRFSAKIITSTNKTVNIK